MSIHEAHQRPGRIAKHPRVWIENQNVVGVALSDANVGRRGVAPVLRERYQPDVRELRSHHLGAAVHGGIVDDNDGPGERWVRFPHPNPLPGGEGVSSLSPWER